MFGEQQYHVVQLGTGWVGLKLDFSDGQAGKCICRCGQTSSIHNLTIQVVEQPPPQPCINVIHHPCTAQLARH